MKYLTSSLPLLALAAVSSAGFAQVSGRAAPPRAVAATPRPEARPRDATGRCRDGSFTTARVVSSACADRGGVLVSFAVREAPPAPSPAVGPVASALRPGVPSGAASGERGAVPPAGAPLRVAEEEVPAGAIARCRDGSPVMSGSPVAACESHQGVAVRFPVLAPPPTRAAAGAASLQSGRGMAAPERPVGATAHCRDGSYSIEPRSRSMCAANGGPAAILPEEPGAGATSAPPTANTVKQTEAARPGRESPRRTP